MFNFRYKEALINTSVYRKSKYHLCAAILKFIAKLSTITIKTFKSLSNKDFFGPNI